jgi:hypothetical protein
MIKVKLYLIFLLSLVILGCESSTEPKDNSGTFTVSGILENKNGTEITDDMGVYILWTVSSGSPDYTYVWGKGTIDKDKMTFKVELPNNPPEEALNLKTIGVGQIFLLKDQNLPEGKLPIQYDRSKFVGATAWFAIIYKENDNSDSEIDWLPLFKKGYNIGVGVEGTGTFDSFKPVTNETIKLIIDEILNIKFVNWT